MGAPATQGRLCTTLNEMQVGDYIRCTYTAPTANMAGVFSDLGGSDQAALELPTSARPTANGFFYFLKADQGLLIADREIQGSNVYNNGICWGKINEKNYIIGAKFFGGLIRSITANELIKYIGYGDLNGSITVNDSNTWNLNWYHILQDSRTIYCNIGEIDCRSVARSLLKDEFAFTIGLQWKYIGYRPIFEYIDNKKSQSIYY